jgi:hypothetical protein
VVVVVAAQQGQVVEVGRAAVDPFVEVVAFAPFRWVGAAGEAAAGISGDQRQGLAAGGDPAAPAQGEDGSGPVEDGAMMSAWSSQSMNRLVQSISRRQSQTT